MDPVRERVKSRMKTLDLKFVEVHRRMGLGKSTYVNDFVNGKQNTFDPERVPALAVALECSVEYLTGESSDIGSPPSGVVPDITAEAPPSESAPTAHQPSPKLPIVGIVEAGVFRKRRPADLEAIGTSKVTPLPDVPLAAQTVYEVGDSSLAKIDVTRGSLLHCVKLDDVAEVKSGTIVLVERTRRDGEEVEISAREVEHFPNRTELRLLVPNNSADALVMRDGQLRSENGDARIVARVVQAVRDLERR